MSLSKALLTALVGAVASVSGHGHIIGATTADGEFHQGWDPDRGMGYGGDTPPVVGWSTTVQDNGFVTKKDYSSSSIICHRGAENAQLSIEMDAGDVLTLHWSVWPESHHGPVMDYLAPCGSAGCAEVDKEELEFFKISEVGLMQADSSVNGGGFWGADLIREPGFQWQVRIPKDVKSGEYVLRHEILSLHQNGEPQNYPQCLNLKVTGGGKDSPKGMKVTELYDDYEDFNIYTQFDSYPIPGPPMIDGAEPIIDQKLVPEPNPDNFGSGPVGGDGSGGNGNNGNSFGNGGNGIGDDDSNGEGLGSGAPHKYAPSTTCLVNLAIAVALLLGE